MQLLNSSWLMIRSIRDFPVMDWSASIREEGKFATLDPMSKVEVA